MSAPSEATPPEPAASHPGGAARGTVWLSAAHGALLFGHAAVLIAAGRLLTTEDYGRFAVAFLALSWVTVAVAALLLPGLAKIVSEDAARFPAALAFAGRWYAPAVLVLTLALWLAAAPLARAFGDAGLAPLLSIVAIGAPLVAVGVLGFHLLNALHRFRAASVARARGALVAAAAAGALLLLDRGAAGALLGLVTGAAVGGALLAWQMARAARGVPRLPYAPMARRVAWWTAMSLPALVGLRTLENLDVWLVKGLVPDAEAAGLYAVAWARTSPRPPRGGAVWPARWSSPWPSCGPPPAWSRRPSRRWRPRCTRPRSSPWGRSAPGTCRS